MDQLKRLISYLSLPDFQLLANSLSSDVPLEAVILFF